MAERGEMAASFEAPEIKHKNILSRESTGFYMLDKFLIELADKPVSTPDISNASDVNELRGNLLASAQWHGREAINLYDLGAALDDHMRELVKVRHSSDIEDIASLISNIKVIQTWIGEDNLNRLKSLGVVCQKLDREGEIDALLEVALNLQENLVDELEDSRTYYAHDFRGREIELYSPQVNGGSLERLIDTNKLIKKIRSAKAKLI
jgi:hypothetical protein